MMIHVEGLALNPLLQTSDFCFACLLSEVYYSPTLDCSLNIQEILQTATAGWLVSLRST